ncbi:MAG TPA: hypothetical protein VJV78_30765 [Polyangiales bacterium]|nr:hypothetical protein [Polyangiales bacterium]
MRIVLCALLGLMLGCSDEHRPMARDAEVPRDAGVGEDARVPPPRDASMDRDAGQPGGDCKPAKLDEVALLLYESSDDGRVQPMPISTAGSVQFDGIVTAHGSGIPAYDVGPMGPPPGDMSQYRFVRIAVAGMLTRTIITRGLPALPVRDGAQVHVQLKSNTLVFGPIQQWLVLHEGADLAFFYAQESALERLPDVRGFRFRVGRRACTLKNDCGDVGSFALMASLPSGATVSIERGQRESLDGFSITHHETRALLGMSSGCPDYSPGQTRLMVERNAIPTHEPFDCVTTAESDLAGVRVEFPDESCTFSLEQARKGVDMRFRIVVDRDIADVAGIAPDAGRCQLPEPGLLEPRVTLGGNRQFYGIVDVGGCAPQRFSRGTLRRGTYPGVLHWEGRNWYGPSDTGNPVGAAFPAGLYTLTVTASGYVGIPDDDADSGTGVRFTVGGTRRVLITD